MTTSRCPPRPNLIVVGASVRAFGCSAQRVGWSVHAADLFGDADLRAVATTTVAATEIVGPYPASLVAAVEGFPRAPWCYTGALENHPQVIATLAAARPLLGASPDAARSVRDHHRLADVVRRCGTLVPGHGTPTDDPMARSAADRRYLDWILGGLDLDDPRSADPRLADPEMRDLHARNVAQARASAQPG
jgi:hypothetical protein